MKRFPVNMLISVYSMAFLRFMSSQSSKRSCTWTTPRESLRPSKMRCFKQASSRTCASLRFKRWQRIAPSMQKWSMIFYTTNRNTSSLSDITQRITFGTTVSTTYSPQKPGSEYLLQLLRAKFRRTAGSHWDVA